jgi:LemA protein
MRNLGLLGCVGALILAVVIGAVYFIGVRNHLVTLEEQVDAQWGQVQTQYQRRADLIPNLVNTVKGAANFERETLQAITEARAKVGQVQMPQAPTNPQQMAQFEQAQAQLGGALSRLLVVAEAYPELKANANFRDLQSQLEGTENRIAVARKDFNETATAYNTAIRKFPASVVAGMSGFQRKPYFQSAPGSENAPTVKF